MPMKELMMMNLKSLALSSVLGIAAATCSAQAEERKIDGNWSLEIGAGVGIGPDYEGSDDYGLVVFPAASLTWKETLFISVERGIGGYLLNEEDYQFGAAIGLTEGRDESDNDDLRGLGDVDMGAGLSLFGSYNIGPVMLSGDMMKGVSGDNQGLVANLAADIIVPLPSEKLMVSAGPRMSLADDEYMATFFGVSNQQAARSVYNRFDAEGGVKNVGLGINAIYEISDAWSLGAMAEYSKLVGDAADSPIVKEENQFMVGLHSAYRFSW